MKHTFGVILPSEVSAYSEVKDVALVYECLGYDSVWLNDHMYESAFLRYKCERMWNLSKRRETYIVAFGLKCN